MEMQIFWESGGKLLLGAIFVAVYALERFNTPKTNRSSTTAARYYAAASSYLGISLLIYWGLAQSPQLLDDLKQFIDIPLPEGADPKNPQEPVVEVAMLLSVLLCKIPILAQFDYKLRAFFQNLAEIPMEAIRFSKLIAKARFNPSAEMRDAIRFQLLENKIAEEDIQFDTINETSLHTAQALWVRITALKQGVDSWATQRGYAGFLQQRNKEYDSLNARYIQLNDLAKNYFSLLKSTNNDNVDNPLNKAVEDFRRNYVEQANTLADDLCQFVASGVLQCQLTHGNRIQAIHEIGFEMPQEVNNNSLSINRVLTLLSILVMLLLVNFIAFAHHSDSESLMIKATMIGTIFVISVVCATFPKGRWEFFRRDTDGTRPTAGYLFSGLLAVALAVPINVGFNSLIFLGKASTVVQHSQTTADSSTITPNATSGETISKDDNTAGKASAIARAWEKFSTYSYPWLFMAFASTVLTAFMVDNRPSRRISARQLRWLEAFGQATGTLLAACLVLWWLADIRPLGTIWDILVILLRVFMIGGVIGALVPSWYRKAMSVEPAPAKIDIVDLTDAPEGPFAQNPARS